MTQAAQSPLQQILPKWLGLMDYTPALEMMKQSVDNTIQRRASGVPASDAFFYLEHPPVITYGRATPVEELELGGNEIPRISVPRGGLATYHAPGQLIGYIILDLSRRENADPDIHAYLRAIEQGLINFIQDEFDLPATRRAEFTGVWTPPDPGGTHPGRKLASIGVSARKWVTSHGFALNIHPDMSGFGAIVPCGITDARMTSIKEEQLLEGKSFTEKPMETWAAAAHTKLVSALQAEGWLK